jgi:hypothetical protein
MKRYFTGHVPFAAALVAYLVLMGLVSSAHSDSRAQQTIRAFAAQRGLPLRTVQAGPANRKVTRIFVPVTEQHWRDFADVFKADNGFTALRFVDSNNHLALAMKPGDCYLWARNYNGTEQALGNHAGMYFDFKGTNATCNGYVFAVDLQGPRIQHLAQWLEAKRKPNNNPYAHGNCMEWLPNAEVGPGRALFHELGIKRSKDGRNMKAKLLHAANAGLEVVGVTVNTIDQFKKMTDAQLLGPPPASGADDAAR